MKILMLDIETAPHRVYAWGLWEQNIAINQIEEPGYTLCWAAKWYGKGKVMFASVLSERTGKLGPGTQNMLEQIHALIDEADVVVHYNGTHFDMPTLNQEFLKHGLGPPAPYAQVDLLLTARRRFRLPSNKMDYVATHLGIEGKLEHKGMELWRGCMQGNAADWKIMKRYNIQDVRLLEQIYDAFKPWIISHPNAGLYPGSQGRVCTTCGSSRLWSKGLTYTKTMVYARLKCEDCGAWSRERRDNRTKEQRAKPLVGIS